MRKIKQALLGFILFVSFLGGIVLVIIGGIKYSAIGIFLLVLVVVIIIYIQNNKEFKQDNSEFSSVEIDNTSSSKKIHDDSTNDNLVNPLSGGLMMGGMGGIDTFGNSFGSDISGGFSNN